MSPLVGLWLYVWLGALGISAWRARSFCDKGLETGRWIYVVRVFCQESGQATSGSDLFMRGCRFGGVVRLRALSGTTHL